MPKAVTAGDFGSGVSPIVADGAVVLVRDQVGGSQIIAIDTATGSRLWEEERQSIASYSTPTVWDVPEGKQIAVAGHARMIGYDLRSGDEKWFVAGLPSACCPSPVTADGVLYFAGWSPGGPDDSEAPMPTYDSMLKDLDANQDGTISRDEGEKAFQGFFDNQDANKDGSVSRDEYDAILKFMAQGKNVAFALKPGGAGDVTKSLLWTQSKGLPYVPSAIVYRGQYVMVKDGGIVTAYDADTGRQAYQERAVATGKYYASPVAAGGNIYFTSLDGEVTVLKAGTEQPEVVAKNPTLGERTSASPAIAGDTLFVRTEKHLYAFGDK
jgi:outer membrane protein assembly factor BamB